MVTTESFPTPETRNIYRARTSLVAFEDAVQRIRGRVWECSDSTRDEQTRSSEDIPLCFETEEESRRRRRSVWVVNFAIFTNQLAYSFIFTSGWPYLQKLDPTADKYFMGWVIAATPVGMIVSSPLLGKWSDWLGSVRLPCVYCCLLTVFSSATYAMLGLLPSNRKYWMLANRFISGTAGIVAPVRSYVSSATTLKERTPAFAIMDLCQALGFILGPALQAALTPLGSGPTSSDYPVLSLDMYTSGGWMNTILGVIVTCLFLPGVFTEHKIPAKPLDLKTRNDSNDNVLTTRTPDFIAIWTCIIIFFIYQTNGIMAELLPTPVAMDQFGWTEAEAVKNNGIIIACLSVIATVAFASVGPLSKMYDDRKLLIYLGASPYVIGTLFLLPLGNRLPRMQQVPQNTTQAIMQQSPGNFDGLLMPQQLPHKTVYNNTTRNYSQRTTLIMSPAPHMGTPSSETVSHVQAVSLRKNSSAGGHELSTNVTQVDLSAAPRVSGDWRRAATKNSRRGAKLRGKREEEALWLSAVKENIRAEHNRTVRESLQSETSRKLTTVATKTSATSVGEAEDKEKLRGCPPVQKWCLYIPALTVSQFITGCFINTIGFAFTFSLTHSMVSKLLGPGPQGWWMGLLTLAGSLAKAVGPVLFGYLYAYYGTYATFGTLLGTVITSLLLLVTLYNRLVPLQSAIEYIPLT